jgi:hypothetical protein
MGANYMSTSQDYMLKLWVLHLGDIQCELKELLGVSQLLKRL